MNYQEQYIQMITAEFHNRKLGNKSYSLRAFARDIQMEAPRLSMILNKKKGVSLTKAREIVKHFSWCDDDKDLFLNLVESSHGRSKKSREMAESKILEINNDRVNSLENFLVDDEFLQIAEPIHYLVIEGLKIQTIEKTIDGLSSIINYSKSDIETAVSRLCHLGYLSVTNGNIEVEEYILNSGGKVPSMALRKHHLNHLQSAIRAVNEQDVNERILSSLTIAVPKDIVPEIAKKINSFRREINEFILNHQNQNKTEVYCLASQFFKLTTEVNNEKN